MKVTHADQMFTLIPETQQEGLALRRLRSLSLVGYRFDVSAPPVLPAPPRPQPFYGVPLVFEFAAGDGRL